MLRHARLLYALDFCCCRDEDARNNRTGRSDTFEDVSQFTCVSLTVTLETDPLLRTYSEGMKPKPHLDRTAETQLFPAASLYRAGFHVHPTPI